LQEKYAITSQKTPFFIVTAVKTSKLTWIVVAQDSYRWRALVNEVMNLWVP
jgi:hypothetical protein